MGKMFSAISSKAALAILPLFAFFAFLALPAIAETMSSSNYRVQNDALIMGGGNSSSTGYDLQDALGNLATGENLSSASYDGCAGFECFQQQPYLAFSVKQGTAPPGTVDAGVTLGSLNPSTVTTSNGTTVNSIFITAESNASAGLVVTTRDVNAGLKRVSGLDTIASATATLVAGTDGFGLCVFSASQHGDSPSALAATAPYNSTCTKTTGHAVGALSTTPQNILASSGPIKQGAAEVLVKAAVSSVTPAGDDYQDTITFIATGTY